MRRATMLALLRVGTLGGLMLVGCAAGCASLKAQSEIQTQLDALNQQTAAIASNVEQTKQELTTQVNGIGNKVDTVTQNFDPATMHLIVRGVLYLAGGIVLLESLVLVSNLWLARCRYREPGKCGKGSP